MKNNNHFQPTKVELKKYKGSKSRKIFKETLAGLKSFQVKVNQSTLRTIADVVTAIPLCKSVSFPDIANAMPRTSAMEKSHEQTIARLLQNQSINVMEFMNASIRPYLLNAQKTGKVLTFMMDQSSCGPNFECLMISVRYGKRAKPVLLKIIKRKKGGIGFPTQRQLLIKFCKLLADYPRLKFQFTADRFYGTRNLIIFLLKSNWDFIIRVRHNLLLKHEGETFRSGDILEKYPGGIENVQLGNSPIRISMFTLADPNDKDDCILVMNGKPTRTRALQYGKRWGIEAMFSDLKTRGFNIEDTKLQHPERVERLLMCTSIALEFCIGLANTLIPYWHKYSPAKQKRSKLSPFQLGLRRFHQLANRNHYVPKFWKYRGSLFEPGANEIGRKLNLVDPIQRKIRFRLTLNWEI